MKKIDQAHVRAVSKKILTSSFTLGLLMVILGNSLSGLGIGIIVLLIPIVLSFFFGALYSVLHKKHISKIERYKVMSINLLSLLGGLLIVFSSIARELGWLLTFTMIVVGFAYYTLAMYFFLGLGSSFYMKRRKEGASE